MENQLREVIIIGSGPAGLTAGIYAGRAGLKPLILAGYEPGGQLTTTTIVENFPGFPEGVDGPILMAKFTKQAEKFGSEIMNIDVSEVDLSGKRKKVKTLDGQEFRYSRAR